jgi:hypothetical protein
MNKNYFLLILSVSVVVLSNFEFTFGLENSLVKLLEWKSRHIEDKNNRSGSDFSPFGEFFQWIEQVTYFLFWGIDSEELSEEEIQSNHNSIVNSKFYNWSNSSNSSEFYTEYIKS